MLTLKYKRLNVGKLYKLLNEHRVYCTILKHINVYLLNLTQEYNNNNNNLIVISNYFVYNN